MGEDKVYLSEVEEKAFFERLRQARIASGIKKNFELYGIGDESQLAKLDETIRDGEEAMKQLPELYGNLVEYNVSKYKNSGIPYTDLQQEGATVLYSAAAEYDSSKGRFTTYLTTLLRSRFNTLVMHDGLLTETNWARQCRLVYEAALKSLAEKGNDKPTDKQISEESGLTVDKIKSIRDAANLEVKSTNFISLDQELESDSDGGILSDMIAGEADTFETVIANITSEIVDRAIEENLTANEALVIRDRYGLNEENAKITREDIAKKLGATLTDIRMYERSALIKLAKVKELKGLI